MTPQNFREFADKRQQELAKLLRSDLPRLMGTKAMQHFRQNFARGGFLDDNLQAWPSTWRQQTLSGADGQRGPLLSRTNTLRNRILFKPAPGRVRIYNDLIYAAIHNNGGNITITPKMRKKFWAMYYKALGTSKATTDNGKGRYKGRTVAHLNATAESEKWKRMALTKKTQFVMPQRKFIGPSQTLTRELRRTVEDEIRKILTP